MTDRELRESVQRYVDRMTDHDCYRCLVTSDFETDVYLDYMPENRAHGREHRAWRNAFRAAVNLRAQQHADWPSH